MKVTLYIINWNDKFYIPFIKEHYGNFCERIVMYDNHSDDGSQELAKKFGFEVRTFGFSGMLDDQAYLNVKNHCWKEERGNKLDFVIVCDIDEFLYPATRFPTIIGGRVYMASGIYAVDDSFKTITAPKVQGYNMISDDLPESSIFEISTGDHSEGYSKQCIFNPDKMEDINFVHGCHKNNRIGEINTNGPVWNLFHYRQIGGLQRMLDRHALYRDRLSKFNLKHNLGHHYGRPDWTPEQMNAFNESKRQEWETLSKQSIKLW